MLKRIMTAMAIPVLGIALAGTVALATPGGDECCCVTNDAGQLVCTITDEVLETCCCD